MRTTYNKFPEVSIRGYDNHARQGWSSIHSVINTSIWRSQNRIDRGLLSGRAAWRAGATARYDIRCRTGAEY